MKKCFLELCKKITLVSVIAVSFGMAALMVPVEAKAATTKSVTDYSYTITPLLPPFNEYFFVKTDNPDPTSFRFADKSSKYSEDSSISLDYDSWDDTVNLYADIKYENTKTGRVNGGYIFSSFSTDGGQIVLQTKDKSDYSWSVSYSDTNKKYTLPALKDDTDYLIDTYADKSDFFDNMDAVQSGFSSICLYSGSNIRGKLYRENQFWSLSSSPHKDQSFYIQSPYRRKDNQRLFASAIYPYRYDSLGFPGKMATVATRLDSSATYEWDSNNHYIVNVTYKGETKQYGGQGNGEGQGISEDKIKQYFTFGTGGTDISLEGVRTLLREYAAIDMVDDVPREDALTWKSVCDKVGSGSWVSLTSIGSVFGGGSKGYAYLYKKEDGTYHYADSAGNNGSEIYWSGNMGYASDAWVDGRYVDGWENYVPGEKFEDHPTSKIIVKDVTVPQIQYRWIFNEDYTYTPAVMNISESVETVVYKYSSAGKVWTVSDAAFDIGDGCADYSKIADFVDKGILDEKYLDMVTLTLDEVKEMKVDGNTNIVPDDYYIYDGTAEPGTAIKDHKHNYECVVTKEATCKATGVMTYTCRICDDSYTKTIEKKTHKYTAKVVKPSYTSKGYTIHTCSLCNESYKDSYKAMKRLPAVKAKSTYSSSATNIRIYWSKVSGATGYRVYKYDSSTKQWKSVKTINDGRSNNYKDSGLKPAKVYKYKVRAFVKESGKTCYGDYSNIITATTKPSTVKIKKSTVGKTSVSIYWSKVTCNGYVLQRYNSQSKKWVDVKTISSSKTSIKITGLKRKTQYIYRIAAYKKDGNKTIYGGWGSCKVGTK